MVYERRLIYLVNSRADQSPESRIIGYDIRLLELCVRSMLKPIEFLQLVKDPTYQTIVDTHRLLCLRLAQVMILIGEKIGSQQEFLKRADISRSNAFNVIRASSDAKPPSARTIASLAACCMRDSPVPWSAHVSTTIAESLLPSLRNPSTWQDWRDKNEALIAFADEVLANGQHTLDQETIVGSAVVRWFAALGDYCDGSDQTLARYRETCDQLTAVLDSIEMKGPFVKWVQFRAIHDRYAIDFNAVPKNEQKSKATKERFEPFFKLLLEYIDAGNPTLIAEHMNALVYASRFDLREYFPVLRAGFEQAWRRHNGDEKPNYKDRGLFDDDFDHFRMWLRRRTHRSEPDFDPKFDLTIPTTIPKPISLEQAVYRFIAIDANGTELEWNDVKSIWEHRRNEKGNDTEGQEP